MKTTQYLYGIEASELDNKFYFEALSYKVDKGGALYKKLYMTENRNKEEDDRMFYVLRALDKTRELIEERSKIEQKNSIL